jgi:hypothetical protein
LRRERIRKSTFEEGTIHSWLKPGDLLQLMNREEEFVPERGSQEREREFGE